MTETLRPYGLGKFDTILDSYVYQLTLYGADDQIGDVQEYGRHYAILRGFGDDDQRALQADGYTPDEIRFLMRHRNGGAIVSEDSQGFVTVEYFEDRPSLDRRWAALEDTFETADDE